MANLRTFKKDVIFLINEVISDCWVFMYLNRDKNVEEANKIVADAVELGDNLLGYCRADAIKIAQRKFDFFIAGDVNPNDTRHNLLFLTLDRL